MLNLEALLLLGESYIPMVVERAEDGSKIGKACVAVAAILASGGCSSLAGIGESAIFTESDWLSFQRAPMPLATNELKSSSYAEVSDGEVSKAIQLLESLQVIELREDAGLLPSARNGLLGKRLFLLRAKKDDMEGAFSVYLSDGRALILYNHLGGCGNEKKSALVVASETPITEVFGGCSSGI